MARFELVAGARLDRYELMFPLAEGGMAAVWLARLRGKRGFEQLVAIKTIKAHLSEDVRFEQMFLDEARIASRIRHPNVAQILDLGEEQGILYLVMEWVDGSSLSRTRRLVEKRGGKIPLNIALRIMADVASGLHAAHELKDEAGANLGVIHRDVSPQNILVATSGAVKVIDFGIAKARGRATAETTDGLVKGKVAYMSPEQADGRTLDRRADVWAVGVCLYEVLTEKLPFDGETQQEILRLLVKGTAVPPLPTDLPSVVRGVIEQALARDPANRFLTATALERALEGALTTLDAPTTSDDVATFLAKSCPENAAARKEVLASVERITESLDGGGAQSGPVTKDITPAEKQTRDITQSTLATGPSDSVEVSFEPKEPPTQVTLHSASVSKPTEIVPARPRSNATTVAIAAMALVIVALGYIAMTRRAGTTDSIAPVVAASTMTTTTSPSPSTSSTSTASIAVAPSAAPHPSASSTHPSSTRVVIAPTTARPTATIVKSATTAATGAVQYDSDGIPIVPPLPPKR